MNDIGAMWKNSLGKCWYVKLGANEIALKVFFVGSKGAGKVTFATVFFIIRLPF